LGSLHGETATDPGRLRRTETEETVMYRSGFAPVALIGFGAFALGAMMFGGAATAGAATIGAAVLWPFFMLLKLAFFFLLFGFVARAFWGRGPGRHGYRHGPHRGYGPGRSGWYGDGPWAPPWSDDRHRDDADVTDDRSDVRDPRAWFEQRAEDWHLKAHARMDIDREVPDPTRDDSDDRDVV
jgi:hypothetical protein